MSSQSAMVREFHRVFDCYTARTPSMPPDVVTDLRIELIREEFGELAYAIQKRDLVEIADALADLLYVTHGAALAFGIPIESVFEEVHNSNMSKLGPDGKPIRRADGKILKSSKYFAPRISEILANYGGTWESQTDRSRRDLDAVAAELSALSAASNAIKVPR